jgi:thioredoxin-dependent peroxiredoxin
MKRLLSMIVASALCQVVSPAAAALAVGARAPDFSASAALAGKRFGFSLAAALAKGPVVVYFFPAAFTPGCSIEAHEFADAMAKFEALGAGVIGVSTDKIETLERFSVEACQNRFPVASDAGYSSLSPDKHVEKMLDALRDWRQAQPRK